MAEFQRNAYGARPIDQAHAADYDEGLRKYMLGVYNYMLIGLAVTGAVAFFASQSMPLMQTIHGTWIKWVVMLAPLGLVFFVMPRIHSFSLGTAQLVFWGFAALMGLSLSYIFLAYTGTSIARVFMITGVTFGAMSLYGYTTKRDLTNWGSFLFMGLIGIIIASVVNIFVGSSALQFAISIAGVLIFTGLTAYDTQAIKSEYNAGYDAETAGKGAIMGALRLYLDFINLFLMLLQLLGNRE